MAMQKAHDEMLKYFARSMRKQCPLAPYLGNIVLKLAAYSIKKKEGYTKGIQV